MEQTNYVFDATQHEPDVGFEAIPAGTYNVTVDATEVKDMAIDDTTGQTKGWMLRISFKVADGAYAGSKVGNNYNIGHKTSAKTVEIAHKQLSSLCHVTGVFRLDMNNQAAELRGKALRVTVDNDGKYNGITAVMDVHGNKPSKAGSGAAPATTAPVASATPSAWGAPATPPAAIVAAPTPPTAPAVAFPPAGWAAHPSAAGYFYKDQEVLTEAQLRERTAVVAAPAIPSAPMAPAPAVWNQNAAPAASPNAASPWGAPKA